MKRIKIINRIIYCVILLAFLIFMGSAFIFSTVDMKTPADSKKRISIKPENTRYIGDGKIEYHIKLDATSGNNMALAFVSRHQNVEVYAGNKLIYYVRNHKSIYGTTTGTNYTIINVPSYTTDVVVEECEFAESKNAAGDNSGFTPSDRPSPSSAAGDGFMNIPDGIDEELPFN